MARRTLFDPMTWEEYRSIIGSLRWEWKPDQDQHNLPADKQSGTLTTRFTALPEGGDMGTLQYVLEMLTDQKPQLLQIEGETVINARCKELGDFSTNTGVYFDQESRKEKKRAARPAAAPEPSASARQRVKPAPEPATLEDAVFYRSHPPGTKVYAFIPAGKNFATIQDILKDKGIALAQIVENSTKGGQKGTRFEIAPTCIEKLDALLREMNIPLHPNPHISFPSAAGRGA